MITIKWSEQLILDCGVWLVKLKEIVMSQYKPEAERDNEALTRFTTNGDITLMGLYKATKHNLTMCGRILGHNRMTINRVFYSGIHTSIIVNSSGNLVLLTELNGGVA